MVWVLNRIFLVCIANIFLFVCFFTEVGTVKYGIPQSSIFEPLLFILYVNDLPQSLSKPGSYLYANSTNCYKYEDISKMEDVLKKYIFIIMSVICRQKAVNSFWRR